MAKFFDEHPQIIRRHLCLRPRAVKHEDSDVWIGILSCPPVEHVLVQLRRYGTGALPEGPPETPFGGGRYVLCHLRSSPPLEDGAVAVQHASEDLQGDSLNTELLGYGEQEADAVQPELLLSSDEGPAGRACPSSPQRLCRAIGAVARRRLRFLHHLDLEQLRGICTRTDLKGAGRAPPSLHRRIGRL